MLHRPWEATLAMRGLLVLTLGLASTTAAAAADGQAKAMDLMHSAAELAGALSACSFGADENVAVRSKALMNSTVQSSVAAGVPSSKDALLAAYGTEFNASKAVQTTKPANCDALLGKLSSLEMRAGTR